MRIALEEARKCKAEDERVHPKVGVVVVHDGQGGGPFKPAIGLSGAVRRFNRRRARAGSLAIVLRRLD